MAFPFVAPLHIPHPRSSLYRYPDSVAGMPEYLKAKIHAKKKNIGKSVSCKVVTGGCDGGTCG